MLSQKQIRSLELLRQFVEETPKDELADLLNHYQQINPEGVTYAHYLTELNSQLNVDNFIFGNNSYSNLIEPYHLVAASPVFGDDCCFQFVHNPPPEQFIITNQKDPEFFSGFFFIHLLDDGSQKSPI